MNLDFTSWRSALFERQLSSVNELKGVAILLVMLFHSQLAVGWINWSQGQVGVDVFLIISGWLIGRSLNPGVSLRDFFWHRIWRIVPAYWAVLMALCVFKHIVEQEPLDWANILAHLLGLQIFGHKTWFYGINPSFWFISLLLLTYPLAFALRKERSPARILATGMSLAILAYWLGILTGHHSFVVQIPARLISFCAGLAIATSLKGDADHRRDRGLLIALFAVCGYFEMGGIPLLRPCLYAFALIALYLAARGGTSNRQFRAFPHTPLAFLGVISYEIFLLHQPMLRLGFHIFPLQNIAWGAQLSAAIGILISVMAAWILHAVIALLFRLRPLKPAGNLPQTDHRGALAQTEARPGQPV